MRFRFDMEARRNLSLWERPGRFAVRVRGKHFKIKVNAPHPSPLPMGEGVRPQPLNRRPLSQGERDRVRGERLDFSSRSAA